MPSKVIESVQAPRVHITLLIKHSKICIYACVRFETVPQSRLWFTLGCSPLPLLLLTIYITEKRFTPKLLATVLDHAVATHPGPYPRFFTLTPNFTFALKLWSKGFTLDPRC